MSDTTLAAPDLDPGFSAAAVADLFLTPRRDLAPARALELPGARADSVPTRRGELAYLRAGDDAAGPPVLLVHGWEGQASDLQSIASRLVARGRAVLAVDLPAHGRSAGRMTSIPWSAEALLELQAAVGPLAAVVAHSVGAAVTVTAMAAGLEARAVALLAAPSRYVDYARGVARMLGLGAAETQAFIAELARRGIDVHRIAMPLMAPQLRQPALFVHADDDRVVPLADAEANHAAWPGARLMRVRGLGHRRLLDDAAVLDEVEAFVELNAFA